MNRGIERRIFQRKKLKTEVFFEDEFGEKIFYLNSTDISLGGLFLETQAELRHGTMLFLSFMLSGKKRPIHATGEVIRAAFSGKKGGVGIRFIGLSENTREEIENFLSR